jgi:uncharacterized protein (DUF433 family)
MHDAIVGVSGSGGSEAEEGNAVLGSGYDDGGELVMSAAQAVIRIDPDILSGTPCFAGTRVPVQTLWDYLKAGDRIADFLEDFPTVTHEQVDAVIDIAGEAVAQNGLIP